MRRRTANVGDPARTWSHGYFRYISKRVTRDIVQEHQATKRKRSWSLELHLKLITLAAARRKPDYRNRYEMALMATDALEQYTGTHAFPGDYVRAETDLRCCYFPVHLGWNEVANAEVAVFIVNADLRESGRTFVALIGSIENYVGRIRRRSAVGNWCPSDVMGLYDVLSSGVEQSGPALEHSYLTDDLQMSET